MTPPRSPTSNRRTLLTGLAVGVGASLAGCTESDDESDPADDDSSASTDESGGDDDSGAGDGGDEQNESDEDENSSDGDFSEVHADYDETEVSVMTLDGEELGEVTAAVADTSELQTIGLSDTEELPEDRGMIFINSSEQDLRFIMPDMSFGIDIIYADSEGVITGIHHAPKPGPNEDGSEQGYPGYGQFVLEVNYEWTTERGIEEGDVLEFSYSG
ncbi:hypothetical protein HALLA_06760 [Halostagnicola larsenii XH-48]|uniref:DUF192 domain-containing protein n=1 Tax=Halostagnicola larsenii XH-48 TaxID=797299 RepID=W0JN48_9EURY|nr:DUF192 domain-containing protein [Halostagnicola larsenii]AHF98594.1 hypothetical protein HALLA_06760 [Halostagnicola larsenii XH-48]